MSKLCSIKQNIKTVVDSNSSNKLSAYSKDWSHQSLDPLMKEKEKKKHSFNEHQLSLFLTIRNSCVYL